MYCTAVLYCTRTGGAHAYSNIACTLQYNVFAFAESTSPPNVQLTVLKRLEATALTRRDERNPAFCRFLLPSEEDDTVHFVDTANGALKRLNLQNDSLELIYRCDSSNRLVGGSVR